MSEHLNNVMEADDSVEEESNVTASTGKGRVSSLMDMDYEEDADKSVEPEDTKEQSDIPLKSASTKEEKEEKEPKKEKEDKEEKKEEEKKELAKQKFKIKVDGQEVEEEFDEEQIKSALSGQKAIQKRFTELDQQKKSFTKDQESFKHDLDFVKSEMQSIKDGFSSDIEEFKTNGFVKGNPVKSVYNLLDKMGLDASQFEKAVFFHHLPEAAKFLDMGDAERDAFLLGRENEWLRKGQDAVKNKEREASEYRTKLEQENSVKRQAGVSEEAFSELKDELVNKLGIEKPTTEQILEWNKAKPFYTRAENISQMVPGSDVHKLARILLEFPDTTDEWMLEQLGYKEQQEKKIVEELKGKVPAKKPTKPIDDEVDDLFDSFRGRGRRR